MLAAVLSGFFFALFIPHVVKVLPWLRGVLWIGLPATLFGYFLMRMPEVFGGMEIRESTPWVPSLGANLSFVLDGVSLMFAVMITFIGTLVFFYTRTYLKGHPALDRFYAYLSFFMASMLGLVLSDSLMLMFIFWELTSISSFFLIGFNNKEEASRKSALTALAITGLGGFGLLGAAILVGQATGSYTLEGMYAFGNGLQSSSWYALIVLLVFAAAFTKSAQFPFHFWLPAAMKAPTPVSTYLHSATMVKAGIFLLLRFSPVLGGQALWNDSLMVVGAITMLYAALAALFKTDLKAILAYTTIAALGVLTFLIGLGTAEAITAALVFIFVHALYKATLFLVTGIVDHEAHTRDVTRLSGLRKVMAPVALAALLAALSSAGLPGTFGFIGKDLIYEGTLHYIFNPYVLTGVAVVTNIMLLQAGFVAGIKPFAGPVLDEWSKLHSPSPLLWAAPLLLGILCVVFGIAPVLLEAPFIHPALSALQFTDVVPHLKLWHGFNTVLVLSVITLVLGTVLYFVLNPSHHREAIVDRNYRYSPEGVLRSVANGVEAFALRWTRFFQADLLRYYVLMALMVLTGLIGLRLAGAVQIDVNYASLLQLSHYEWAIALTLVVAITVTVLSDSRLAAVVAMGVVGYAICLLFVFYSAPDLAMTQFTIDTLTVILFVLVLYKLPRYVRLSSLASRARDWMFATIFGFVISLIALAAISERTNKETSQFYSDNAYVLAKGKNIVNVILVDFRGMDTLVEITVLSVAAVGVFSLLKLRLKKSDVQ